MYNNVYGMNPAYGSAPYDLEDITQQAVRYGETISKAIEATGEEVFTNITAGKLTSEELKQLKLKMAEELTPILDA